MNYFQEVAVNIEGNKKLRTPQVEAYLKIKDYFLENPQGEALVVLPTGTGKSGLISIAPYGVSNGRVLIITPGLVTKESISKTQESIRDNFWINYDIVFSGKDIPVVSEYTNDILQEHLESSNIVYSNIQKVVGNSDNCLINRVPKDFFDMIIVDESHHAAADSWQRVLDYFSKAKKLHVTGTPFRGDGQPIPGEKIHETPLSEVMRDKYIKYLKKETLNNHQLFFTIAEKPNEKLTVAEVLKIKDSDWISKSVALSKECSKQVIEHSTKKLDELKKLSPNVPHKILAVGCSIKHSEDLRQWYDDMGYKSILIHSKMNKLDQIERFRKIENHECDVVVSVNMLMEGYDHKYLSILSIFRPYRSLNAFAQVIGRVLRVIPENEITAFEIDNNATVIYHQETGLDDLWKDFQKEVDRAKVERIKDYSDRELSASYERRAEQLADIESGKAFITGQDSFLEDIDFNELFKQKRQEIESKVNIEIDKIKSNTELSSDIIEKMTKLLMDEETQKASDDINSTLRDKRPSVARKELRTLITKKIQDGVADILADMNIEPKDKNLASDFLRYSKNISANEVNDACLVKYINAKLYSSYGSRDKLQNNMLQKILNSEIPTILDEIRIMLK